MIERRPYLGECAALREFARTHPCPRVPTAAVPRFLDELTSGHAGVFDLWVDGRREVLAVVVDTCDNPDNAADLVVLGLRDATIAAPLFTELLALAFAAAGPRSQLDIALDPFVQPHRGILHQRGFCFAYANHRMRRAAPVTVTPRTPLPAAARFVAIDETNVGDYYAVVRGAFAEIPGASVPSREAFCRSALARANSARQLLLAVNDQVIGFATINVDMSTSPSIGEVHSIGRDPTVRGRGLGEHLLGQALELLAAAGVEQLELEVAAPNLGALDLYERFGFEVVSTLEVLRAPVRPS